MEDLLARLDLVKGPYPTYRAGKVAIPEGIKSTVRRY
jgi:hypothetical protein